MNIKIVKDLFFGARYLVRFTAFFLFALIFTIVSGLNELSNWKNTIIAAVLIFAIAIVIILFLKIFCGAFVKNQNINKICYSIVFMLIAVSVGIGYSPVYNAVCYSKLDKFDNTKTTVCGKVVSEPSFSSKGTSKSVIVKPDFIGNEKTGGKIKIYLPIDSQVEYGQGISFEGELSRPPEKIENFQYRRSLLSEGCYLTAYIDKFSEYEPNITIWDKFCGLAYKIRTMINQYADHILPDGDESGLFKGILIGNKADFSDELYINMSTSGFMHIAAVSGLHISFIFAFVGMFLKFVNRKVQALVTIPVLILFSAVSMFTPSVNRAVIMMAIYLMSYVFMKDADPITSLFAAALFLIVLNPYVVFSVSFILSFVAVLSLMVFSKPLFDIASAWSVRMSGKLANINSLKKYNNDDRLKNVLQKIITGFMGSFTVAISCQIGILPVIAYYFNIISLGSVLGNIIVIPCTVVIFVAGFLNFILYLICPAIGMFLSMVLIKPFLSIICNTASVLSNLSFAPLMEPTALTILIYYIFCVILYNFLTLKSDRLNRSIKTCGIM